MRYLFCRALVMCALSFAAPSLQAETTRSGQPSGGNDGVTRNCKQGRGMANQRSGCRAVFADGAMLGNERCNGAHKGCDYARENKSVAAPPVYALHAGKVIWIGFRQDYGNRIVVQNRDGSFTTYNHLSGVSVRAGATVRAGAKLGMMGATGRATGVHLHIEEIDSNGNFRNPGSAYGQNFC